MTSGEAVRRLTRPRRYLVGALVFLVGAGVLVAVSATSYTRRTSPTAIATGYFQALARGDAAAALGYAQAPQSGPYLTARVLRQQLAIESISDISAGAVTGTGSNRQVAVSYSLTPVRTSGPLRRVLDHVSLVRRGSSWRLVSAAATVDPVASRWGHRLTLAGRPLAGAVRLFPGALPLASDVAAVSFATPPYTALTRTVERLVLTPTVSTDVAQQVVTAAEKLVQDCLAGRSTDVLCPGPSDVNFVPGTATGTVDGDFALSPSAVTLTGSDGSTVRVTGSVSARLNWKRWTLDDRVVSGEGTQTLPFTLQASTRTPTQVSFVAGDSARSGPAVGTAVPGPAGTPEWWFTDWQVRALWQDGADGRGITVAVVDTGVDASVPDLSGVLLDGTDYLGQNSKGKQDFDANGFSHGTAMAGLIAGALDTAGLQGTAPGARILPIAVPLDGEVSGLSPQPDATASAVRYAADHGARVISMSLGGFRNQRDATSCPAALQAAVVYALAKGSLVVAASGNSGTSGSPVEEPGSCHGVVSVGAVTPSRSVAGFSSRHAYLTLVAPGTRIPTIARDSNAYYVGSGTSQATALASAAIALVWSAHPGETNRQILTRVLDGVVDLGPAGHDDAYGYGFIDPYTATQGATPTSTNPVFADVQPLLDRTAAAARPGPGVLDAAGRADAPLGVVAVTVLDTAPDPAELAGAAGAGACLLLMVVFLGLAVRARRRARTVPATPDAL